MSTRLAWGHVAALAIWIAISGAAYLYFDARQKPTIITRQSGSGWRSGSHSPIKGWALLHTWRHPRSAVSISWLIQVPASYPSVGRLHAKPICPLEYRPISPQRGGRLRVRSCRDRLSKQAALLVENLSVGVGIHGEIGLLGQNFLRHVDVLQLEDKMVLRIRP